MTEPATCSFCGDDETHAEGMFEKHPLYICFGCVDRCHAQAMRVRNDRIMEALKAR